MAGVPNPQESELFRFMAKMEERFQNLELKIQQISESKHQGNSSKRDEQHESSF